ncbi:NAD binding domain of 6-phosphogluconate dehydrogenase [Streptomyces sp. YIM 121038]|uniref:NAD(P)-dependent oxidoreductase n=1 Tax=Streptomyces sp. YIM 121038 TaxID=2136401 RepID=UPI0011101EED|nr:DUF1932 domain-containing protein [Streptomyces sp. YIM 121038]QCX81994.1 NAD binding domain of 6-phosphogluconate dehydrogenase [Streptomyces sp. YIM 121038]
MHIAVIGLGEAGSRYATALAAAGHETTGFDPGPAATPGGVRRVADLADAVRDAEMVLLLTPASWSVRLATQARPALAPGTCWADLTAGSPAAMTAAAEALADAPVSFADVAILGTVPLTGARTAVAASGPGGPAVTRVLRGLGAPVELLPFPAGAAAARKLLRSVLMKPLALVICEAVEAARAAGCEEWMREQITDQLGADGPVMIDRFLTGTRQHAERRAAEMRATVGYLDSLGVPSEMSSASAQALLRLTRRNPAVPHSADAASPRTSESSGTDACDQQ